MKTFEIGKKYSTRSICDHNCIFSYTVTGRTAATVKAMDEDGNDYTFRINKKYSEYRNAETIFPLGRYSMCPIISADMIEE